MDPLYVFYVIPEFDFAVFHVLLLSWDDHRPRNGSCLWVIANMRDKVGLSMYISLVAMSVGGPLSELFVVCLN